MTATHSISSAEPDWARPLYEAQIGMLSELAEMAMEAARTAKDEVQADLAQGAIAFGRAARAVRLTLMLQARLIQALEARDNPTALAATADRYERPTWIERIIVDAAERDGAEHTERLVQDAAERLDREDLAGDLLMDRVSDLAALIRRDLGVGSNAGPLKSSPVGGGGPAKLVEGAFAAGAWRSGTCPSTAFRGSPPSLPSGGPRRGATRGGEDFETPGPSPQIPQTPRPPP